MHVPEQSHHEARQYPVSYKVSQTGIRVCGGRILHQAEISRKERGMGCGREGEPMQRVTGSFSNLVE